MGEQGMVEKEEKYRPGIHFSGKDYIVNDPNGLVYYKGEYHFYYQYNISENIHWGHAVSKDLVEFIHEDIAVYPDEIGQIWSGSVIVDEKNRSGLKTGKEDVMVAFFTYYETKTKLQSQGMAYSNDKGRNFEKYQKNPIIPNSGETDFRDPKVFWYAPEEKWVMVLAAGRKILFYDSYNLLNWEKTGEFGEQGSVEGVWECPDLFELKVENTGEKKWVLLVSVSSGAPASGSGMQYFVGDFDGKTFLNEKNKNCVQWLDYGKDFYAGTTWNHIPKEDGRRLLIGWADNWQYRDYLPTVPFKGQYSCVREISLKKSGAAAVIVQKPVMEMEQYFSEVINIDKLKLEENEQREFNDFCIPLNMCFKIQPLEVNKEENIWGIKFAFADGGQFIVEYNHKKKEVCVNREKTGRNTHKKFPVTCRKKLPPETQLHTIRIIIDYSQTEIFINEGEIVFTNLIFPYTNVYTPIIYSKKSTLEILGLKVSEVIPFENCRLRRRRTSDNN